MADLHYNPSVFDVANIKQAQEIILTPEDSTTQIRWEKETPILIDMMLQWADIGPDSLILDYGCGVGRLAKELIRRTGCTVVGADISASMRALAADYVSNSRFVALHPDALSLIGDKFDFGYAVWVLQHCANPKRDISLIRSHMKLLSSFMLVNNERRAVPTDQGWVDDGQNIDQLMENLGFDSISDQEKLPMAVGSKQVHDFTFWKVYRARH